MTYPNGGSLLFELLLDGVGFLFPGEAARAAVHLALRVDGRLLPDTGFGPARRQRGGLLRNGGHLLRGDAAGGRLRYLLQLLAHLKHKELVVLRGQGQLLGTGWRGARLFRRLMPFLPVAALRNRYTFLKIAGYGRKRQQPIPGECWASWRGDRKPNELDLDGMAARQLVISEWTGFRRKLNGFSPNFDILNLLNCLAER